MSDAQDLSSSVEQDLNNFLRKASIVDETPVIEGFGDLLEVANLNPPPGVSRGNTESDQNINPTDPFSITVNGSTDVSGAQASPFTLDCLAGSAEYPARGTATSPQSVTYASPTAISVSPSSGTTKFIVYAKVGATMTANNGLDVDANGTIVISETSAASDKFGSNTRFRNNGSGSYTYFFLIGTVTVSRRSDNRYSVLISQIQQGNYSYDNVKSTTATVGGATVSTKDGPRKFTICINGEPFTADIDVSNIVKVT